MASWQDKVMTSATEKGAVLYVKVTPKASRTAFRGVEGEVLCFWVAAVPEGGRANRVLIDFLSSCLHFPKSGITLLSGAGSRYKRLLFADMPAATLCHRLAEGLSLS